MTIQSWSGSFEIQLCTCTNWVNVKWNVLREFTLNVKLWILGNAMYNSLILLFWKPNSKKSLLDIIFISSRPFLIFWLQSTNWCALVLIIRKGWWFYLEFCMGLVPGWAHREVNHANNVQMWNKMFYLAFFLLVSVNITLFIHFPPEACILQLCILFLHPLFRLLTLWCEEIAWVTGDSQQVVIKHPQQ